VRLTKPFHQIWDTLTVILADVKLTVADHASQNAYPGMSKSSLKNEDA
jgi:hypothetical protein